MDADVHKLPSGYVIVEVNGEKDDGHSPAWYRAVMHDPRLRELIRREIRPEEGDGPRTD
jgi:hypothetical protein